MLIPPYYLLSSGAGFIMYYSPLDDGVFGCLGTTSKPNTRLTGGTIWFRPVSILLNNDNCLEPDGTTGQPVVGFCSRPLAI